MGMSKEKYNVIKTLLEEHEINIDLETGIYTGPLGSHGGSVGAGYILFGRRVRGIDYNFLVHQVIAVILWGEDCIGKEVNHKNRIKTDNSKNNLELVTRSENNLHAIYSEGGSPGKNPIKVKLINKKTGEIRKYPSLSIAAKEIGGDFSNAAKCLKNPNWTTKGWYFRTYS